MPVPLRSDSLPLRCFEGWSGVDAALPEEDPSWHTKNIPVLDESALRPALPVPKPVLSTTAPDTDPHTGRRCVPMPVPVPGPGAWAAAGLWQCGAGKRGPLVQIPHPSAPPPSRPTPDPPKFSCLSPISEFGWAPQAPDCFVFVVWQGANNLCSQPMCVYSKCSEFMAIANMYENCENVVCPPPHAPPSPQPNPLWLLGHPPLPPLQGQSILQKYPNISYQNDQRVDRKAAPPTPQGRLQVSLSTAGRWYKGHGTGHRVYHSPPLPPSPWGV